MNFNQAISSDKIEFLEKHWEDSHFDLNKNYVFPMPPTFFDFIPLILAIESKAYNSLKWLLEKGASIDHVCSKTWMTAIQYAQENDPKAYQIILDFQKTMKIEP